MLVLARRPEERIIIADQIVVTVLRIEGDRVTLGIEAPAGVPVMRQELLARRPGHRVERAEPVVQAAS